MGVNVRPRVLSLASLQENVRDKLVDLTNELEKRVIRQVLEGELALSCIAGILCMHDSITLRQ